MCVLPPQTPCFLGFWPICGRVGRGELFQHVRLSVKFLVVSGGHVYGTFYLFFDVCAWFKELFLGVRFGEAVWTCVELLHS